MSIDDPKFTAYALDALPAAEKEAIEPVVLADEELWREAETTAAFAEKLKFAMTAETNARLSSAHWREIFAEVGVEETPGVIPFEPARRKPLPVWALSAAAGVTAGAIIASVAITWSDRPLPLAEVAAKSPGITRGSTSPSAVLEQPGNHQPEKAPALPKQSAISKSAPALAVANVLPTNSIGIRVEANVVKDFPSREDETELVEPLPLPELLSLPGTAVESLPENVATPPRPVPFLPVRTVAAQSPRPALPKSTAAPVTLVANKKDAPAKLPSAPALASNISVPKPSKRAPQKQPSVVAITATNVASSGRSMAEFSTLGDLNAVMVHEGVMTLMQPDSIFGTFAGMPNVFSCRVAPEVKVNVILDNGGVPVSVTSPNTSVLFISEPYVAP